MQKCRIIDGSLVAKQILDDLRVQVSEFKKATNVTPSLIAILVGQNSASQIYVNKKIKACEDVGIKAGKIEINSDPELLSTIQNINHDQTVHGCILQMPLPQGMNPNQYLSLISPEKDVDVFHPFNIGLLSQGKPYLKPCTPYGIQVLLEKNHISLSGKHVVIINRSNIVGKPLSLLMLQNDATVTVCHDKTYPELLKSITKTADIVVVAVGIPNFLTPDMIRKGAGVIDVGINRLTGGKIVGDCHPDINTVAEWLTPVPGGVGPMTVAMLLENTLNAAKRKLNYV
jgi:methylenetetrahydrofolate dehydrogenase (NADP+)/methenyltetrahydrofolate cyclohydrolase